MKLPILLLAVAASVSNGLTSASTAYLFYPENTTYADATLQPVLYNASEAQLFTGATNSYWTCSYVTASNGHQYVVLGHTLFTGGKISSARASILDVTDPTYYQTYLYVGDEMDRSIVNGMLDATSGNLTIKGLDSDSIKSQRIISSSEEIPFNLTYYATSNILYNGALGNFTFGGSPCGEFSIPAALTEGYIAVNGSQLAIDPAKSFTWYDRTPIKASIWAIDDIGRNIKTRFGTFRFDNGAHSVLSFDFEPDEDARWTSPITNVTYTTRFTLKFPGYGLFTITSIREDQETHSADGTGQAAYEGFSKVEFQMFGLVTEGYGLIEQVRFNS